MAPGDWGSARAAPRRDDAGDSFFSHSLTGINGKFFRCSIKNYLHTSLFVVLLSLPYFAAHHPLLPHLRKLLDYILAIILNTEF